MAAIRDALDHEGIRALAGENGCWIESLEIQGEILQHTERM